MRKERQKAHRKGKDQKSIRQQSIILHNLLRLHEPRRLCSTSNTFSKPRITSLPHTISQMLTQLQICLHHNERAPLWIWSCRGSMLGVAAKTHGACSLRIGSGEGLPRGPGRIGCAEANEHCYLLLVGGWGEIDNTGGIWDFVCQW